MSRLVTGGTKDHDVTHIRNGCLHPFSHKELLDSHILDCMCNPRQAVRYPDPDDEKECTVEFCAYKK